MKNVILIFVALIGLVMNNIGCSHRHLVESKTKVPEGVKVGIGGKEVAEGEKVNVFISICREVALPRGSTSERCNSKKVGEATVLKILDDQTAIVSPNDNLRMDDSMKVEKQ